MTMAPYDDWNKLDEEEDEELQDSSVRVPLISRIVTTQTHASVFDSHLSESMMSFCSL